jgi:hypothetical protein
MNHLARALAPVLVAAGLIVTGGSTAPAGAAGGPTGDAVTIMSQVSLSGYDVATASDGTTYLGWIGDDLTDPGLRALYLCVLKATSSGCVGGVQSASALGSSSAQNLRIVITGGKPVLVWIAQVAPSTGEFSGVFGTNTVTNGQLGSSVSVPQAPTLGTLTSAIRGPGGAISAAVIGSGTNGSHVYYYPDLAASPREFTRPYMVGNAQIADNGKQTVLTTSPYGSITDPVNVAFKQSAGSGWSSFYKVPHAIPLGGIERLQVAGKKIRMVGPSDKALYRAYTWTWKKRSFRGPKATSDPNDISTVDTTSDASRRLASVHSEVKGLAVSNFGSKARPGRFLLKVKNTYAGGPAQIATSPSGRGWVIYSVERTGVPGQILKAQKIKLSAVTRTVKKNTRAGKVLVTGPSSCMPVSTLRVGVKGKPAAKWKVVSKTLKLGSKAQGKTLKGTSLKPNHAYKLTGSVVFAKGGARVKGQATVKFTTCGRP